jgi:hypothetical protein
LNDAPRDDSPWDAFRSGIRRTERLAPLGAHACATCLAEARQVVDGSELSWSFVLGFYAAVQPATDASQHEHSV